jgi:hypothetical protein
MSVGSAEKYEDEEEGGGVGYGGGGGTDFARGRGGGRGIKKFPQPISSSGLRLWSG